MRGFFGRQRVEKTLAPAAIGSYESALYPPRSYFCHAVDGGQTVDQCPVMLPSIDADSVCKPLSKEQTIQEDSNNRLHRPTLHDFFSCFGPEIVRLHSSSSVSAKQSSAYTHFPLSILEEPSILLSPCVPLKMEGASAHTSNLLKRMPLRMYARQRPPRPIRRGAKVTLGEQPSSSVPRKRSRTERDGNDEMENNEDSDAEDDRDDEISVNFDFDDDDDGGSEGRDSGGDEAML